MGTLPLLWVVVTIDFKSEHSRPVRASTMTVGKMRGVNAMGTLGWTTVRCRICGRLLDLSGQRPDSRRFEPVYMCPKCAKTLDAYFCAADARSLKYRCPFCGSELVLATPVITE
ncbi:MAG: hypothetical protein RXN87_04380 [Acidilobus sp.]